MSLAGYLVAKGFRPSALHTDHAVRPQALPSPA